MMIAPFTYADRFENASYLEILEFKDELVSAITKFEHDFDRADSDWKFAPGPDVQYQWNLEVLGLMASMLAKAFNREYKSGEKDTFDYGQDMRKFYKGKI